MIPIPWTMHRPGLQPHAPCADARTSPSSARYAPTAAVLRQSPRRLPAGQPPPTPLCRQPCSCPLPASPRAAGARHGDLAAGARRLPPCPYERRSSPWGSRKSA